MVLASTHSVVLVDVYESTDVMACSRERSIYNVAEIVAGFEGLGFPKWSGVTQTAIEIALRNKNKPVRKTK